MVQISTGSVSSMTQSIKDKYRDVEEKSQWRR